MDIHIYRNTNTPQNRRNLGYIKVHGMRLIWLGPIFVLVGGNRNA